MIAGTTRVFAVVGHPITHSRSPALHNAWFRHYGIDAVYVALDVDPRRTDVIADALRHLGLAGVNLTIPHKRAILDHVDAVTPAARAVGAANVVFREGTRLIADNTDVGGLATCLVGASDPHARRVAVLGAGGAGRAAAAACAGLGASHVILLNRTRAAASDVASALAPHWPDTSFSADTLDPDAFRRARPDVVVVCTAGPGDAAVGALPLDAVSAGGTWLDINYWRPDPRSEEARAKGLRCVDGRGMLIHQAALAFERFTGILPDCALVDATLG